MVYEFECSLCGLHMEKDLDPQGDISAPKGCSACSTNNTMHRVYGGSVHVPFQWTKESYDFTKRPSKRKQYW